MGKSKQEKINDCESFIDYYAIFDKCENNVIKGLIGDFLYDTYNFSEYFDLEGFKEHCNLILKLDLKIRSLDNNARHTTLINYLKKELDKLLNEI